MLDQAVRPRLVIPSAPAPKRRPPKPVRRPVLATAGAKQRKAAPKQTATALRKPAQTKQRKPGATKRSAAAKLRNPAGRTQRKSGCPTCAAAAKAAKPASCPTCGVTEELKRPPAVAMKMDASGAQDPAERQADAIGARIGASLASVPSFGPGPLPEHARAAAEPHLGVSLAGTVLRADRGAQRKAASESALAVTEGRTVSFAKGQFSSSTSAGRALIGHELTHVGQQGRHRVGRQAKPAPAPMVHRPANLPTDPKAVKLDFIDGLVRDQDLGGLLWVIRGRSMTQMIDWVGKVKSYNGKTKEDGKEVVADKDATKHREKAIAALKAGAAGAGGPRLEFAVQLVLTGKVSPSVWKAVAEMNPTTQAVMLKEAALRKVYPPCTVEFPQECGSFGEWIMKFPPFHRGKAKLIKHNGADAYVEIITQQMPSYIRDLVRSQGKPLADCADVALILRDYYRTKKARPLRVGTNPHTGMPLMIGVGSRWQTFQCMVNLNSQDVCREIKFYRYAKSNKVIKNMKDLAKKLNPGDVFCWRAISSGGGFAGHIQIVRSVSIAANGQVHIVFVQGTQAPGGGPAGEVEYESNVNPWEPRPIPPRHPGHGPEEFVGAGPWKHGA